MRITRGYLIYAGLILASFLIPSYILVTSYPKSEWVAWFAIMPFVTLYCLLDWHL